MDGVAGQIADPAQHLLRLVSMGEMVARIGIELEDLEDLRTGQPASITIPSLPGDKTFSGVVGNLGKEVDPDTQLLYVWVYLDNPEGVLLPGMFAEAQISVKTEAQALVVPRAALLKDEEGSYVFVITEGKAHKLAVQTGICTEEEVQILEGLALGQEVVCEGNYELEDGMAVAIQQGQ